MNRVVDEIAQQLADAGVTLAWGMPGGDTLPLIDALAKVGIRFILVRDESSAGFAAVACHQLTGQLGVCIATLGPGLTNLLTGVAGAHLDRGAVIAITARYRSDRRASYTHMMLDQTKLMEATGKAVFRLTAQNASREVSKAIALAKRPRPGVVWLEVPSDAAKQPTPQAPFTYPPPSPAHPDPALLQQVRGLRRPVALVGYDARHADIEALAATLKMPVLTSYKAKGALPEEQGWAAGAAGLSPVADKVHQQLVAQADGLVLLGWDTAELRDHWLPGWGPEPTVIAIDTAATDDLPSRIDALHVGPIAPAVDALIAAGPGASEWSVDAVSDHRKAWLPIFDEACFGPATAIRAVRNACDDAVVAAFDVGAHRITGSHVWRCAQPDTLLQSNNWSSMGIGIPAAFAAAACGHKAVAIVGDMGLQMTLGELAVATEQDLSVVVVVLLDAALSLIALKQERTDSSPASRGAVVFGNPDIGLVAQSMGWDGVVVDSADALTQAVQDGLSRQGSTLIGVHIDAQPYRSQM